MPALTVANEPAPAEAQKISGRARAWPPVPARRGLGLALLGLASTGRLLAGEDQAIAGTSEAVLARPLFDVLLGVVDLALELAESSSELARTWVSPVLSPALGPVRSPAENIGRTVVGSVALVVAPLAERGRRLREKTEADATGAVARVLPEGLDLVLDQVDLTDQAIARVDFDRMLAAAFDQVDMAGLMIDRVDLERIVLASLDQVDLTELALERLDLERVVLATLERVDVLTLARDQVDPGRVAAYLRDNVDVAEVLRTAPGDAVRGVFDTMGKMVPGRA